MRNGAYKKYTALTKDGAQRRSWKGACRLFQGMTENIRTI
jgi:hypothetical protein